MENSVQILNYLKILNPKNEGLTRQQYKEWQQAFENNNRELCEKYQLLAYYDACKLVADWYIEDNRNIEDFKDATQETFLFVSYFKPKTKHHANYKQELAYFLKTRLERIEKNKLEHNLYLHHDWTPDIKTIPDEDAEPPIEKLASEERAKKIMKEYSLLKYPRKKEFLLRYCGITGKHENMHEIGKSEGMTAGGVQHQISRTIVELRKKKAIRQIAKELNSDIIK